MYRTRPMKFQCLSNQSHDNYGTLINVSFNYYNYAAHKIKKKIYFQRCCFSKYNITCTSDIYEINSSVNKSSFCKRFVRIRRKVKHTCQKQAYTGTKTKRTLKLKQKKKTTPKYARLIVVSFCNYTIAV